MAIFLGKTEGQDAWVVGEGPNVLLTRSVRRIDRPWSRFTTYFRDFTARSWEFTSCHQSGQLGPSFEHEEKEFASSLGQQRRLFQVPWQRKVECQPKSPASRRAESRIANNSTSHPGEEGSGEFVPMEILPLPWALKRREP